MFFYFSTVPSNTGGPNNYTFPLLCSGRWDYHYNESISPSNLDSDLWFSPLDANPFAGSHFQMYPSLDRDGDGVLTRDEYVYCKNYEHRDVNGNILFNNQNISNYLIYGSPRDAFVPGTSLSLNTNPAPVPVLTYESRAGNNDAPWVFNDPNREPSDTRKIYLNNIGVEIVEERPNPNGHGKDMVVRISWDKSLITEDVRWCGSMVASGGVDLAFSNQDTKIDRSLTPTIPYAEPDGIFSLPSSLRLKAGSSLYISDGSNFYVRNNSSLIIEQNAAFFMQHYILPNDAPYVEIQENASALVSSNLVTLRHYSKIKIEGKMTLEDSSLITLENAAQIEVAPTGTLKIHSDNILLQGALSKVVVYGTLEILNNENFDVFGSGRFVFAPGSQLILGSGAKFAVSGTGINDVKVELLNNTTLNLDNHDVDLTSCKILLRGNSKITAANINVALNEVSINGTNKNSSLEFSQLQSLNVFDSYFEKMNNAFKLSNTTIEPFFYNCEFYNNTKGIVLNNVDRLKVYDSNFSGISTTIHVGIEILDVNSVKLLNNNFNNLIRGVLAHNYTNTGLVEIENNNFENCYRGVEIYQIETTNFDHCSFENNSIGIDGGGCSLINFYNGSVDNCQTGILVEGVTKLSLNAANNNLYYYNDNILKGNNAAIHGINSTIFISKKTIIENNDRGIYLEGSGLNQNMLVVGDLGCVSIINNDVGISGNDFFLDIDAQIHACNRGNCNNILPTNFSGNNKMIDVCYNNTAPNMVLARENYWGLDNQNNPAGLSSFNYTLNTNCSSNISNISIDDTDWRTSNSCGFTFTVRVPSNLIYIIKLPTYNQYKNNDFNEETDYEYYEKLISEIDDENLELINSSNEKIPSEDYRTVAEVFEEGYRIYLTENYTSAIDKLNVIANLSTNSYHTDKSLYLIIKAKNLVEHCNVLPNNYFEPSGKQSAENVLNDKIKIKLSPNPFKNNILIKSNESAKLKYNIYNIEGKLLLEGYFNKIDYIDLSIFNKGMYFIKIHKNEQLVYSDKIVKI